MSAVVFVGGLLTCWVLVDLLGACGFIGFHLSKELLDENIHSQVMIKNLEKDVAEAEDKIEYLLNLTRKLNGNSN